MTSRLFVFILLWREWATASWRLPHSCSAFYYDTVVVDAIKIRWGGEGGSVSKLSVFARSLRDSLRLFATLRICVCAYSCKCQLTIARWSYLYGGCCMAQYCSSSSLMFNFAIALPRFADVAVDLAQTLCVNWYIHGLCEMVIESDGLTS